MSRPLGDYNARCDYCGELFDIDQVALYWLHAYTTADGVGVFTTGIFCSEPCGEWAARPSGRSGTSRG